jgi:ferric iron reductase protein FhuF
MREMSTLREMRPYSLTSEEIELLSREFRFHSQAPETGGHFSAKKEPIQGMDLLSSPKLTSLLAKIKHKLHSPSVVVTGSQFAKRYSYLILVPALYSMSVFNKGLQPMLSNCSIVIDEQQEKWLPALHLLDSSVSVVPEQGRKQWRDEIISSIFKENISKVWKCLSNVSTVPIHILWENTAVYLFWLYEVRLMAELGEGNESKKKRIQEDFRYLVHEAPGVLFGEKENPMTKFYSPKCMTAHSEEPLRLRKTCCLYYRTTPNQLYCKTCPKVRSAYKA